MVAEPRPDLLEDLDAFLPEAVSRIKFNGVVYAVRSFLDLNVLDALELVRGETTGGKDPLSQAAFYRRQVALLVPTMGTEVLDRLTPRQAKQVSASARGVSSQPSTKEMPVRFGFWFATVARFYGWTPDAIEAMTVRKLFRYQALIQEVRALETLTDSLVTSFPHLKPEAQKEVRNQWLRTAGLLNTLGDGVPRVKWDDVRRFIGAPA